MATKPAAAPVRVREHVYTIHRRCGRGTPGRRRRSPNIEAPEIDIAAKGPKTTAANSAGSSPTDDSIVDAIRTVPRSAAAAANARMRTTQGVLIASPESSRAKAVPDAATVRAT